MTITRNWKGTMVPKYQVLRLGLEGNTGSGSSAFILQLMQDVAVVSPKTGQELLILKIFVQGVSFVLQ